MKVLVADSLPLFRCGIQSVLASSFQTTAVGHASTDRELFDSLQKHPWDLVLLDIGIPGGDVLDVLRKIKREKPKIPVVVMSANFPEGALVRAFKAGAFACLTKETEPEELVKAVRKALNGVRHVGESLSEAIANDLVRARRAPHEALSDREYQVMTMIASGRKISSIAQALSISPKTVSTHRRRLLQKLRFKTNAELVRYAISHKLIN